MEFKPFEKKVWLSSPTMHGDEMKYIQEAYDTNWISTVGKNINEVEKITCEKVGCKYAVALSAGTAALHLAVKAAGVKPGDKVFCSDMTFDATVNPVVYEGGVPVFIDSEYETWNMDPKALEKAFEMYPEVKVVVIVHLYGTPCQMNEIKAICDKHNAVIIEDAAEALGATYKGKPCGQFGDYNAISFNGNKIITGIYKDRQKKALQFHATLFCFPDLPGRLFGSRCNPGFFRWNKTVFARFALLLFPITYFMQPEHKPEFYEKIIQNAVAGLRSRCFQLRSGPCGRPGRRCEPIAGVGAGRFRAPCRGQSHHHARSAGAVFLPHAPGFGRMDGERHVQSRRNRPGR